MQEYVSFLQANPILSLAWVGLLVAVIVMSVKTKLSKVISIDAQELVQKVNKENARVIDVRGKDEFKKGHIVDAINLSLAEIKNNQIATVEKYKSAPIILVCASGMNSSQAAELLSQQGFEQVYNLKGGMSEWQSANLPVKKSKR